MKLYELVYEVVLQGNIRISMWIDDQEQILGMFEGCDHLSSRDIKDEWLELYVAFMFCPGDGWLHIEVREEEDV